MPVAPFLVHDLPGELGGTIATTMNTRKYLMRKVLRGLLRSPIKGFQYLVQSMNDVRRGPAGRRNRD